MLSFRLLLVLSAIAVTLQSSCRVNQLQGECSFIGECAGEQILSECGDGYGCCLPNSVMLMEEYKDFGLFSKLWQKIKKWFENFKISIHVELEIHVEIDNKSMSQSKGLTNQQVNAINKIQNTLRLDIPKDQKVALINKLISDVDRTILINPDFAKDRVLPKFPGQKVNPIEGLDIKINTHPIDEALIPARLTE